MEHKPDFNSKAEVEPVTKPSVTNSATNSTVYYNSSDVNTDPSLAAPSTTSVEIQPLQLEISSITDQHGLGILQYVDYFLIRQTVDIEGVVIGFKTNNKYEIMDAEGHLIFVAAETYTGCFKRAILGEKRPFQIIVMDYTAKPVFTLSRPCSIALIGCGGRLCSNLIVQDAQGELIGTIKQIMNPCTATYNVLNSQGQCIFEVLGPKGRLRCGCMCGAVDFNIYSVDDKINLIGQVKKEEEGIVEHDLTAVDMFSVSFHQTLDVDMKAMFLALVFLVDFQFFEKQPGKFGSRSLFKVFFVLVGIVAVVSTVIILLKNESQKKK